MVSTSPCQTTINVGSAYQSGTKYYIDVTLTKGQWCTILIQNGLSDGDKNNAIARWYLNSNSTT